MKMFNLGETVLVKVKKIRCTHCGYVEKAHQKTFFAEQPSTDELAYQDMLVNCGVGPERVLPGRTTPVLRCKEFEIAESA